MNYRLTIQRLEPHPKAGEAIEGYKYYNNSPQLYPEIQETQVLLVELSSEEFEAVKKGVLAVTK